MRSLPTSQILREMAEDYLHLAADADGNRRVFKCHHE